jgi:drug/metabolite transporter (DMT)-like permease
VSAVTLGLWLAGFSALTTALAHALVKSGRDKLAIQAWVRLTCLTGAVPLALWIGPPPLPLWPWLVGAAAVHALYQLVLSYSYTVSDFSLAYPVARGIAPILTAMLGVLVLGDVLTPLLGAAIAVVSIGIILLAGRGRLSRSGLAAAVLTGALTTGYSIIDAQGVRLAPSPLVFIAWFFVLDGVAMPLLFVVVRRRGAFAAFVADRRAGFAAGVMAPVSFVPALYAFALAPVGAVAAIRETSVLVGMIVAGRLLGEAVDRRRYLGAGAVMIGVFGILAATAN